MRKHRVTCASTGRDEDGEEEERASETRSETDLVTAEPSPPGTEGAKTRRSDIRTHRVIYAHLG